MKAKGLFELRTVAAGPYLVPVDARAQAICAEVGEGKKALVHVHTPRYPDHHRFAFAVLQKIADGIGKPVELVLLWIKHETGRCDYVRMPDGTTVLSPQSIAFESMDQKEFQGFWNDALEVVKEKMLPHMDGQHYDEIVSMLSGKVD